MDDFSSIFPAMEFFNETFGRIVYCLVSWGKMW